MIQTITDYHNKVILEYTQAGKKFIDGSSWIEFHYFKKIGDQQYGLIDYTDFLQAHGFRINGYVRPGKRYMKDAFVKESKGSILVTCEIGFSREVQENFKKSKTFEDKKIPGEDDDFVSINLNYRYLYYYDINDPAHERIERKTHFISLGNIYNNIDKINSEFNYNFYNLSMVLFGGIGPQGMGFTYSTPRGEVVEICSDMRENEAIVIKYKKFLKEQFLKRLKKKLIDWSINPSVIVEIINYLETVIQKKETIHYYKKDMVMNVIKEFMENILISNKLTLNQISKLNSTISEAVEIILRPIKMVDQFKARINLVSKGKLKAEDIAKLTSLKNKSHYDILRERLFFQYVIDRMYEIYLDNKIK